MTEYLAIATDVVIIVGVLVGVFEYCRQGRHQTRQDDLRYRSELADYVNKSSGDTMAIVNNNDNKLRAFEKEMERRVTRLEERMTLPSAVHSSLRCTERTDAIAPAVAEEKSSATPE